MARKQSPDNPPVEADLEIWQNARQYANLIGEIPSSFTSITRSLVADGSKGSGELSQGTRFLVTRLLKGKTILAPLYYLSTWLYPDEFQHRIYFSEREIVDLYKPFDLASFISVLYVYRKMQVVAPASEWAYVGSTLQRQVNIGLQVGTLIPEIGLGSGLLASCMCQLGLGAFLLHDQKGFTDYRRKLKEKTYKLDYSWEMSRWGCTSAHVGALFIQLFGLGVPAAHAFVRGIMLPTEQMSNEADSDVYRFKVTKVWIDSLLDTGKIPNIAHRGQYYPEGGAIDELLSRVSLLRSGAEGDESWMLKTRDSVSPELTPILFRVNQPKTPSVPTSADEEEDEDVFEDEE